MRLRDLKMKTIILFIIAITVIIGISVLCTLSVRKSRAMIEENVNNNMNTYLNAQATTIENFVKQSEETLLLFSKADIVREFVKNPDDEELFQKAQAYTVEYYNTLDRWEGLYIANPNTQVLAYNVVPVIGKILRPQPERVQELHEGMRNAKSGVYDAGIIVSPGTGELCLSMYSPIYDEDGVTLLGYVGGGVFNTVLEDKLREINVSGIENSNFYMINTDTNITYIATDDYSSEQIAQKITDSMLKQVATKVTTGEANGSFECKNSKKVLMTVGYNSNTERNWTVILSAPKDEIYAAVNSNTTVLILISIVSCILILTLSAITIIILTKPLTNVAEAITELGKFNLEENETVIERMDDRNEVGIISHEIETLRSAMSEIISTLQNCSDNMDKAAATIDYNSNSLVEFNINNTATTEEFAAGIVSTREVILQVNMNVQKLNEMIKSSEIAANEGAKLSNIIIESASEMDSSASKAYKTSQKKIQNNIETVSEVTSKLQQISEINSLIDDILSISSQTKLLSLNAAIEAARAGEQGRGFSVVATEIGSLAANTASTAQKIQKICKITNDSIKNAIDCFNAINDYLETDVMSCFEDFSFKARDNNYTITELKNNIDALKEMIQQFSSFSNELTVQMNTIDASSQQNRIGIDDIVDKTVQTGHVAEGIASAAESNKQAAKMISNIIERFSFNETGNSFNEYDAAEPDYPKDATESIEADYSADTTNAPVTVGELTYTAEEETDLNSTAVNASWEDTEFTVNEVAEEIYEQATEMTQESSPDAPEGIKESTDEEAATALTENVTEAATALTENVTEAVTGLTENVTEAATESIEEAKATATELTEQVTEAETGAFEEAPVNSAPEIETAVAKLSEETAETASVEKTNKRSKKHRKK